MRNDSNETPIQEKTTGSTKKSSVRRVALKTFLIYLPALVLTCSWLFDVGPDEPRDRLPDASADIKLIDGLFLRNYGGCAYCIGNPQAKDKYRTIQWIKLKDTEIASSEVDRYLRHINLEKLTLDNVDISNDDLKRVIDNRGIGAIEIKYFYYDDDNRLREGGLELSPELQRDDYVVFLKNKLDSGPQMLVKHDRTEAR